MTEEPCQCSDCQRFYREHDRLIREFPTFKQQKELNWASIQSFRTLCNKVTDELQRQLSERESNEDISIEDKIVAHNLLHRETKKLFRKGFTSMVHAVECIFTKEGDIKLIDFSQFGDRFWDQPEAHPRPLPGVGL